ncbi:GNAT superfamily N-acetyltransferase [Alkalibacillus filiformis]|uniref:GNAT superfamily N-acetyltransferase n=1 Tax=Alkalibacillus filiformis TaxID=200990 RepID=A0ABU0DRI7_9BACI|nr:GNAT family N-acetyltransferase [Alkalibacillus filiformis]MDQ0350949.1 GNAT superfamily N-acetyltransferase [Alkalibacillus filiformis]
MLTFVESHMDQVRIEKKIFNSNPEYNYIAFDKRHLEDNDILSQYEETAELKTNRYLISLDETPIGIIEYGMFSPRAHKPWLSLLLIDKEYQGLGYAKESYFLYENLMRDKGVKSIQIAVHAKNKNALDFWVPLGFEKYDERIFEQKLYYSLEKQLK